MRLGKGVERTIDMKDEAAENPLQKELLDLITLMPDTQTQEIIDYILDLRRIRGRRDAASEHAPEPTPESEADVALPLEPAAEPEPVG